MANKNFFKTFFSRQFIWEIVRILTVGIASLLFYLNIKGASAKTNDFDANGNCVETDYNRMMKIIKDSGFHGYLGIEYEGEKISEEEGVRKTKALLEKVAAS